MENYPHLVHAGRWPTSQEYSTILAAKTSYEDKRRLLLREIQELKARLENAQQELERVETQITAHSHLISPLRRIPNELLRDIFALATPPRALQPAADRVLHAPWTVIQVCKHWYDVGLMYGSLWSQIAIHTPTSRSYRVREHPVPPPRLTHEQFRTEEHLGALYIARCAEILELQLTRSRDADLSIKIVTGSKPDYAQPYLRILLPHLHRATHLDAPYNVLANIPLLAPLHRLQSVNIDYSHLYEEPSPEESKNVQKVFTRIPMHATFTAEIDRERRHLGGHISSPLYRPEILAGLVVYLADCWSYIGPLIPQLPNLVRLELLDCDPPYNPTTPFAAECSQHRNILPRLETLTVRSATGTDLKIFAHISAPVLTELACLHPSAEDYPLLQEFLVASGCELRVLKLQSATDVQVLLDFLSISSLESLQSLDILHMGTGFVVSNSYSGATEPTQVQAQADDVSRILEFLSRSSTVKGAQSAIGSAEMAFLPQLRSLELQRTWMSASPLIDMLQCRRRPGLEVRLASCRLTHILALHLKFSAEKVQEDAIKHARAHIQSPEGNQGGNRDLSAWTGPYLGYNFYLGWAVGLEREPEEKERLEQLVDDGLELWM